MRVALSVYLLSVLAGNAWATERQFSLSLPLVTVGAPAPARIEFNLGLRGVLALEWQERFGRAAREELSKRERKDAQEATLTTEGFDGGIMFERYSDFKRMAGVHWGLGVGFSRIKANWRPTNAEERHRAELSGTTLISRVGYRYVGSDLGFLIGGFLGVKHFQNRVKDLAGGKEEGPAVALSDDQKGELRRRFMTSPRIGVEIGWAF